MQKEEITAIFDQQASSYDEKWQKTAPINQALHLLVSNVLAGLPSDAKILCVGAGTGAEILYLAKVFPNWHFTAVEPSAAMLAVCRNSAEATGIAAQCRFQCGYLDSLQTSERFHAAIAFLVSQFIVDRPSRIAFFRAIADRLHPAGALVSSDLAGDMEAPEDRSLLEVWFRLTSTGGLFPEGIERMKDAYKKDVAVLPAREVSDIISSGGFDRPVQFYQAGLIHAWYSQRSPALES